MPLRDIVRFPDPRLAETAAAVDVFDDALRALSADLLDTLRSVSGLGITGPHVGVLMRIVVTDLGGEARVFVNPSVVRSSDATRLHEEGSVSMPGMVDRIERPAEVDVVWRDLDGAERRETMSGLMSVCIQHEIDQLDGIFFLDRLSRLKRERLVKRFQKQSR